MSEPTNECKHLVSEPCNNQTRTMCTRDFHQAHCKDCGKHLRVRTSKSEPTNETWEERLGRLFAFEYEVPKDLLKFLGQTQYNDERRIKPTATIGQLKEFISEERKRAYNEGYRDGEKEQKESERWSDGVY